MPARPSGVTPLSAWRLRPFASTPYELCWLNQVEDQPVSLSILCRPVTSAEWNDLKCLFGGRGACGGCWCMWWRLRHRDYEERKGETNRAAFKALVEEGPPPGVLAYSEGRAPSAGAPSPRVRNTCGCEPPASSRRLTINRFGLSPAYSSPPTIGGRELPSDWFRRLSPWPPRTGLP